MVSAPSTTAGGRGGGAADAVQRAQEFPRRGAGHVPGDLPSHAHRIAVNEQEKATGAGRRNAGAGTKVAKGSFVEVWKVGERFLFGSGAAPLHAAVPRDQTIKATKTT